ncbi:MAG: hypothetical protein DRJ35_03965 [Thermoprotei archaeon]|nr:MAG: hypothetical protein DRJ35_03965 [Thermoprotei archaeon]
MNIGSSELKVLIFLYISKGYVSRKTLSQELGLGEGVVRRILEFLKNRGIVNTIRSGNYLTELGKTFLENYLASYKITALKNFRLEDYEDYRFALAAHGRELVLEKNVVEIRDCSVKSGSDGALIIVVENNRLLLPPGNEKLNDYLPRTSEKILQMFDLKNGDIVFVSFSRNGFGACVRGIVGILDCIRELNPFF